MKLKTMVIVTLLAAAATTTQAIGARVLHIVAPMVNVYDAEGKYIGAQDAKLFTHALPMTIETEDKLKGRVSVRYDGRLIFLRKAEIETEGLPSTCPSAIVASRAADTRIAASDAGAHAGLATDGVRCLQGDGKR
jgi:hypothetical protein